jgi:hypothetical protein
MGLYSAGSMASVVSAMGGRGGGWEAAVTPRRTDAARGSAAYAEHHIQGTNSASL